MGSRQALSPSLCDLVRVAQLLHGPAFFVNPVLKAIDLSPDHDARGGRWAIEVNVLYGDQIVPFDNEQTFIHQTTTFLE